MLLSWSRRGDILGGSPKKQNGVFFPSGSLVSGSFLNGECQSKSSLFLVKKPTNLQKVSAERATTVRIRYGRHSLQPPPAALLQSCGSTDVAPLSHCHRAKRN